MKQTLEAFTSKIGMTRRWRNDFVRLTSPFVSNPPSTSTRAQTHPHQKEDLLKYVESRSFFLNGIARDKQEEFEHDEDQGHDDEVECGQVMGVDRIVKDCDLI